VWPKNGYFNFFEGGSIMKNRRGKTVLTIAAVAILALAIGQVQAETANF